MLISGPIINEIEQDFQAMMEKINPAISGQRLYQNLQIMLPFAQRRLAARNQAASGRECVTSLLALPSKNEEKSEELPKPQNCQELASRAVADVDNPVLSARPSRPNQML